MIIYILLIVLLFVGGFVSKKKTLGMMTILFMLIMSMFRASTVGLDTIEYIDSTYISSYSTAEGMKSIELVNAVISNLQPFFGNYVLVWFYSIVTFYFIFLSSKRFKVNVIYVFFFFVIFKYYNLSLNIARQFAAASVLLYAYSFLIDENRKRYLFVPLLLFAIGIHSSSLFFCLIYFYRKIDLTKINPYSLAIVLIVLYIFIQTLAQPFVNWANMYALTVNDAMAGQGGYGSYLDQTDLESRNVVGSFFYLLITAVNIFLLTRIIKINDNRARLVSNLFFLGILISMLLNNIYGALGRMQYNISIFYLIAYAYFFMYAKIRSKTFIFIVIVGVYITLYLWDLSHIGGLYGTVPYSFL